MNLMLGDDKYHYLCESMVVKHKELLDEMKEHDVDDSTKLIICGPTGAGKTTLLYRLESDESCEEFMGSIKEAFTSQSAKVKKQGLELGGAGGSTTVTPNFFNADDKLIIDLAGFLETNRELAPILSILNFTLFSKLNNCLFVVIFDAEQIANPALFNASLTTYITEFRNMFTQANFERCLGCLTFVVTKFDRIISSLNEKRDDWLEMGVIIPNFENMTKDNYGGMSKAIVRMILQNYMPRQVDSIALRFVQRMLMNFVVVDYRYSDKANTITQINKLTETTNRVNCNELKFDTVSLTNDLCVKASDVIAKYVARVSGIYSQALNQQDKVSSERKGLLELITSSKNKLSQLKIENTQYQDELNKLDKQKAVNTKAVEQLPEEIKTSDLDLQRYVKELMRMKVDLQDKKMLHIATLRTVKSESRFSNKVHKIRTEIMQVSGSNDHPLFYVLKEDLFEARKNHIAQCKTRADLLKLNLSAVSYRNENKENYEIECMPYDNYTTISVSSVFPLVVIIIYEVALAQTVNANFFLASMQDVVETLQNKISSMSVMLSESQSTLRHIETSLTEKKILLIQNEDQQLQINEQLKTLKTQVNGHSENLNKFAVTQIEDIKSIETENSYQITSKFTKILTDSNVDRAVFSKFGEIKSLITQSIDLYRKMASLSSQRLLDE